MIPRPQLYLALKQGLIEAAPETISIAYDTKDDEVGKYWTRTDEYFQIINIMMNATGIRSLNPSQQKILHDSMQAAGVRSSVLLRNAASPTRRTCARSSSR